MKLFALVSLLLFGLFFSKVHSDPSTTTDETTSNNGPIWGSERPIPLKPEFFENKETLSMEEINKLTGSTPTTPETPFSTQSTTTAETTTDTTTTPDYRIPHQYHFGDSNHTVQKRQVLATTTSTSTTTPIDPCLSTPCSNGGTCFSASGSYICACLSGYVGANCQFASTFPPTTTASPTTTRNNCLLFPCQNGGVCSNTGALTYSCACTTGFIGDQCQFVDRCNSLSPCLNGGTCISTVIGNLNSTYFCSCPDPYYGTNCEKQFVAADCYNKDKNCTIISNSYCLLDVKVRGVPIREACTALCTSCTPTTKGVTSTATTVTTTCGDLVSYCSSMTYYCGMHGITAPPILINTVYTNFLVACAKTCGKC